MTVSIITAAYNSGKTIEDTIKSVLGQTYRDIEYIVKDGCSSDNTLEICRKYEPLFNGRMRIISEKDDGIYDAMNKGIEVATGEVLGFINSDDFFTRNDIIEKVANKLSKEDLDGVYGDVHFVKPDNLEKSVRYYSGKSFSPRWMRFGFMPPHPSFYCKRVLFEKYGDFDTRYQVASDFDLLLRFLFINRIKTKYINCCFVTMRTGGASTSGWKSIKRGFRDRINVLKNNDIRSSKYFLMMLYVYKLYKKIIYRINNILHRN